MYGSINSAPIRPEESTMTVVKRSLALLEKEKFIHVSVSFCADLSLIIPLSLARVLFLTLSCARLSGIYRLLTSVFLTASPSRRLSNGQMSFPAKVI